MLGYLPMYLCNLLKQTSSSVQLRSTRWLSHQIPKVSTELGKVFSHFAPGTWNNLQSMLRFNNLLPLEKFKAMLKVHIMEKCNCFNLMGLLG